MKITEGLNKRGAKSDTVSSRHGSTVRVFVWFFKIGEITSLHPVEKDSLMRGGAGISEQCLLSRLEVVGLTA